MRLKLKKKIWRNKLLSMQESGMGYQIVDIKLKNGCVIRKVLVFNSEIIELPAGYEYIRERDIVQIELSK